MFQSSLYTLPTFAATVFAIWLISRLWQRRNNTAVWTLIVMSVGLAIWTLGSSIQLLVTEYDWKLVFTSFRYLGITIILAAWFIFVVEYTGKSKRVTRRNIILLTIEPILVQLLIFSNGQTNWFWDTHELITDDGLFVIDSTPGVAFGLHATYSYILLIISAFLLIQAMVRAPHLYRGQMRALLIAVLTPWVANFVFIFDLSPLPHFVDLTPLAFTVSVAAISWSIYRYHLVDIIPVARDIVIENMDDAILVLDNNNRVVDANRAFLKMVNQTTNDVIGQPVTNVLSKQGDIVQNFLNVDQIQTDITANIDGTLRTFNLQISGLHNKHEELTGRIIVLHDVTSLKEANKALVFAREKAEEATRLKSLFLATMSHELRTPLNAIIGYSELQLSGMVGDLTDEQHKYSERILANSLHLLKLINDVLDLSKIEAGRMDLIKEEFGLEDWVTGITSQNAALAKKKGIEFVTEIDPRLPPILIGDEGRLKQIVVNLLSNAFKFTEQGTVTLKVRQDSKNTWSIIVSDTGIGISPHKQETIFTEFHQVDNSSTREYDGTGLGLAIVRKLALAMGGNVRITSSLSEGSTFTITLPLIIEPITMHLVN